MMDTIVIRSTSVGVILRDKEGRGGVLYVEAGELKWRDDSGKVTVIAGRL